MKTRERCRSCGIQLDEVPHRYGLCDRCAAVEIQATKRYFRNGLIIGIILAALLFLLLNWWPTSSVRLLYYMRNPDLVPPDAMPMARRILWAALAFIVPFGYFRPIQTKGAPVREMPWVSGYNRPTTALEYMGALLLIFGVITAPIVGPIHAAFRLIRAVRLRRFLSELPTD